MNLLSPSPTPKIYDKSSCGICLETYKRNESNDCGLLKCGHIFDRFCIEQWLKQSQRCPICKQRAIIPLSFVELMKVWAGSQEGQRNMLVCTVPVCLAVSALCITALTIGFFFPGLIEGAKLTTLQIFLFVFVLGIMMGSSTMTIKDAFCSLAKIKEGPKMQQVDYIPPEELD